MAKDSEEETPPKPTARKRPPPLRPNLDLAVTIRSGDSARRDKKTKS